MGTRGPWVAIGVAAVLVVLDRFFALWLLSWLWVFALLVDLAVGLLAVGLVVRAVVVLVRRSRRRSAVAAGLVGAALVVATVAVDWPLAFAHTWFTLNWSGFAEVAVATRDGAYGPPAAAPYYGYPLPGTLSWLSVSGNVAVCGTADDRPVLLVPAFVGIPDGGGGFLHLAGRLPQGPDEGCDAFGDRALPRTPLGGGWWWTG